MITVTTPVITLTNSDSGEAPYLVDLVGFYDSSGPKLDNDERPNGDGDFDEEPVYDSALYFSIRGKIIAPGNPTAVFALRRQIMGLKALKSQWPVTVTDPLTTGTLSVRLVGKILFDVISEDGIAEFEIPVKAADPYRYGAPVRVSNGLPVSGGGLAFPITFPITFGAGGSDGRVIVLNSGDADTFPLLEVTGQLDAGFTIDQVGTGRQVRFERLVPLGSTVFLELSHRQGIPRCAGE